MEWNFGDGGAGNSENVRNTVVVKVRQWLCEGESERERAEKCRGSRGETDHPRHTQK